MRHLILFLLCPVLAGPVAASDEIQVDLRFGDRYEAVDVAVDRISGLFLRDPHVFVEVEVFGSPVCVDATDSPGFDVPGFNEILNETINEDGNGDGFLDASPLLVFSPRGWPEAPGRLALGEGQCTAPAEDTSCTLDDPGPATSIESRTQGLCRGALPDTTRPYEPPVPDIVGPCFADPPGNQELVLDDLVMDLSAATIAGSWQNLDKGMIEPGLLRGFLSEDDAEAIIIPEDIDIIGGQSLASLLPGGEGNCDSGDDRSEFEGVTGWWIYFEYEAEQVPFTLD